MFRTESAQASGKNPSNPFLDTRVTVLAPMPNTRRTLFKGVEKTKEKKEIPQIQTEELKKDLISSLNKLNLEKKN